MKEVFLPRVHRRYILSLPEEELGSENVIFKNCNIIGGKSLSLQVGILEYVNNVSNAKIQTIRSGLRKGCI